MINMFQTMTMTPPSFTIVTNLLFLLLGGGGLKEKQTICVRKY